MIGDTKFYMSIYRMIRPLLVLLALSPLTLAPAQTSTPDPDQKPDPLVIGKQALAQERWADAQLFFLNLVQQQPDNLEAQFDLGYAYFGDRRYEQSEQVYLKVIAAHPTNVGAHKNLIEIYAGEGRWADFDRERSIIQRFRERTHQATNTVDTLVIEVLYVGGERYIVRDYYPPSGKSHALYNFTHFDKANKLDSWISCESDDIDQIDFAKKHPAEAAAGVRSFSLDSYTPVTKTSSGQLTQTHGTIKFYPDGEPTYETVRGDVIALLGHRIGPMSTSIRTAQPTNTQPTPKP